MKTLADTMNGPGWIIWLVFAMFAVFAALILSGHGDGLIAGYNTASEEEKARYDTRRLRIVVGGLCTVIAVTLLVMGIFMHTLPASFSYVFLGIDLTGVAAVFILLATWCRKK